MELNRIERIFRKENHEQKTLDDKSTTEIYHDWDTHNPFIREVAIKN